VKSAEDLPRMLESAFKADVPVLINVPVDYSKNHRLMQDVIQTYLN